MRSTSLVMSVECHVMFTTILTEIIFCEQDGLSSIGSGVKATFSTTYYCKSNTLFMSENMLTLALAVQSSLDEATGSGTAVGPARLVRYLEVLQV